MSAAAWASDCSLRRTDACSSMVRCSAARRGARAFGPPDSRSCPSNRAAPRSALPGSSDRWSRGHGRPPRCLPAARKPLPPAGHSRPAGWRRVPRRRPFAGGEQARHGKVVAAEDLGAGRGRQAAHRVVRGRAHRDRGLRRIDPELRQGQAGGRRRCAAPLLGRQLGEVEHDVVAGCATASLTYLRSRPPARRHRSARGPSRRSPP